MSRIFFLLVFAISTNCFPQNTKEDAISLGLIEHNNSNFQKAIEIYNKVISTDTTYIAAYINRSNAYFELKEYNKALKDIEKAIQLDPNQAISYHNRGLILKFQGKYKEAIIDYDKAIQLDRIYFTAYQNKLVSLVLLNKIEEAKATVENLKINLPNNPETYLVSATFFNLTKAYAQAMNELNIAVSLDKKNEKVVWERAQSKVEMNDKKGAIADYSTLISINPKEAKCFYQRSSVNYDLKEYDKVISDCTQAIALNPNYYEAYVLRGDVYDTYGEEAKSTADYEKAISIRPDWEFAYNELGKIYFVKNKFSKSVEVLNRILIRNANTISSLEYRAACRDKLSDYAGAIEDYKKLISLNPNDYRYYMNKGFVEDRMNNKQDACTDVKKGYSLIKNKLSEDFVMAHNFLLSNCRNLFTEKMLKVDDLSNEAITLYGKGNLEASIKKYDEMITIIPDSSFLYYNRGKMKRELSKHEEAILDYKKAVQYNKKNVDAWVAMGVSYMYLLKPDEAIAANLAAIKVDQNYAMSYHNLGLIYSEKKEYIKAIPCFKSAAEKDPLYTSAFFQLGINYLLINDKENACYNFKRAEALGSIPARLKILSECN